MDTVATITHYFLVVGVAIVVLALIIGSLIIARTLSPLKNIKKTAAKIAAGDLSQRLPSLPENTEVGSLSASLNTMLGKIEESFRITKSYLDARPVFVQKRETIYGHFLVCYLCLFLLRVLEIKCFKNKVSAYDLIEFIRDFRVAKLHDDTYLNLSHNRKVNTIMKKATGISTLDALYLSQKEIDNLFRYIPL